MIKTYKLLQFIILTSFLFPGIAFSFDAFIVLSSDIIPYKSCVGGLEEALEGRSLKVLDIRGDLEEGYRVLKKIKKESPGLIIAVGPQAAYVLSKETGDIPRVFCMVRNPQKIIGANFFPGVSLNMPSPFFQLTKIKEAFYTRQKVGIFFNPASNQSIVDAFDREAGKLSIEIIKFPILSKKDISAVINSDQFSIDVLLIIPDDQLRSEKIISYIIKESLKRKIPVVGYNSWFAKNGALLSFILDYKNIGVQTGQLSKRILGGEKVEKDYIVPPEKISIRVDLKTAKKLGIKMSPEIINQAQGVID